MANEKLKPGYVVVITVGTTAAPRMTVVWADDQEALCIWYNSQTQNYNTHKFPVDCLVKLK